MSLAYQTIFNTGAIYAVAIGSPPEPPEPGFGAVGNFSNASVQVRLERIYASVAGHTAPSGARDTYFLMRRIGQVLGLDLTSGRRSFEGHLAALYADISGSPWTGAKSAELILRAIETEL